jgi:hypothetical protein
MDRLTNGCADDRTNEQTQTDRDEQRSKEARLCDISYLKYKK